MDNQDIELPQGQGFTEEEKEMMMSEYEYEKMICEFIHDES